jgi:outer membrane lipoprotein-sorting protein
MKRPPWIIAASVVGLLGLGGLLLWQWRAVGAPPPPVAALLARALAAETSVDYTGVLHTVTFYQGQRVASTVRVYRQAPDRERMEYVSAELAGLVTGCNEHGCWQYDPTLARTIRSGPFRSAAKGPRREDLIRRNYVIDCTGTDRVAGRPAYVLPLTPKHPGNPSRRLWVDQATFVVLRREDYTADGALRTQTTFREIDYRPRLAANLFDAPADPSRQVTAPVPAAPMTLEQLSAEVGFPVIKTPYLPPGYEYASGQIYRCPCGCGMISAQLQYVDGLNCLTVFETGTQHAGCSSSGGCAGMMGNGQPPCLLADYGYARFASVVTTDPTFTAVGDLAQEELVRVVEGLRRQKNVKSKP